MSWHIDQPTMKRYEDGDLDRVAASSVEAHAARCDQCRSLVTVDSGSFERQWQKIADQIEVGRQGPVERALRRLGAPDYIARIVALSPAFRASFALAVLLVLIFAAAASNTDPGAGSYRIFLIVAPLIPVAGVAFAFSRMVDPAAELTIASPIDAFRLLLWRAAAVLTVSLGTALMIWPIVPAPSTVGFAAWMIPAFALTLSTLALGSRVEPLVASGVVTAGWLLVILPALDSGGDPFGATAQAVSMGLVLAAAVALILRRDQFNRKGQR